jgi:hypothetical protein
LFLKVILGIYFWGVSGGKKKQIPRGNDRKKGKGRARSRATATANTGVSPLRITKERA